MARQIRHAFASGYRTFMQASTSSPTRPGSTGDTLRQFAKQWTLTVLLAVPTAIFINDNVVELTNINGNSMAPTLSPDYRETGARDYMVWKKSDPLAGLARDDVVMFHNPETPEGIAVKRVIALEGDVVLLDRRRRPDEVINGRLNPAALRWDRWQGRVRIPEGHVWVEGDNWRATKDSNTYGPVSKSLINGKAVCLFWPPSRFGGQPWKEDENTHSTRRQTKILTGLQTERVERGPGNASIQAALNGGDGRG